MTLCEQKRRLTLTHKQAESHKAQSNQQKEYAKIRLNKKNSKSFYVHAVTSGDVTKTRSRVTKAEKRQTELLRRSYIWYGSTESYVCPRNKVLSSASTVMYMYVGIV